MVILPLLQSLGNQGGELKSMTENDPILDVYERFKHLDRQISEVRIDVCLQRRGPLRRVLCILPARPHRLDVSLGALAERARLSRGAPEQKR